MKIAATLSLTLNVLLAGFVVWLAWAGARSQTRTDFSRFLTNRVLRVKHQTAPPPSANGLSPEVVETNEPFSWAQVESADYRVYLANLRAIGCPEPTVRDIIIADVNDLFSGRIKLLVDEVSGRFWELITHERDLKKAVEEKEAQLSALKTERDEFFAALFGDNDPQSAEGIERYAAERREQWERVADFLPEEKRGSFVTARENLERAWEEYLSTPGQTGDQQQAKRKELDAAHNQALREWLTTEEYHELRLRQSPAASLRARMVGLDLSEDAVRAVANIQFAKEEAQAALPQKDADFQSRTAQLQQQAEAQTRELLGTESYAAIQRATDGRYDPIYRVTQRLELPDAAAAQAYDIRRQAEDAVNWVRADKSLAAEERQALLQAVSAETKQSLSVTLGPKGFAAYEKIDGGWIQQMGASRP